MSTLAFTSSTTSTRHSDSSLTAMALGSDPLLRGGAPQPLERALEIVRLHLLREAVEGRSAVEERAQRPALLLEVVEAGRVAVGQEPRPALDERRELLGLEGGRRGGCTLRRRRSRRQDRPQRLGQAFERLGQRFS